MHGVLGWVHLLTLQILLSKVSLEVLIQCCSAAMLSLSLVVNVHLLCEAGLSVWPLNVVMYLNKD